MAQDPCAAPPAPRLAMSWVTIVWSMVASACLTLAAMHLLVWSRRRTAWAHLLFSLSAAGVAAYAGCELWMMRARDARRVRPGVAVGACAGLGDDRVARRVRAALPAGGAAVAGLDGLRLEDAVSAAQFRSGAERELPGDIRAATCFVSRGNRLLAEGVRNPWMLVGQLSLLLLVLFVADASLAAWRRGDRRQALVVGGSIAFFALGVTLEAVLVLGGIVHAPLTATLFFLGLIAAMGYQLSDDVLRAARLSDDLREREQQMALARRNSSASSWKPRQRNRAGERRRPGGAGQRGDREALRLHPGGI